MREDTSRNNPLLKAFGSRVSGSGAKRAFAEVISVLYQYYRSIRQIHVFLIDLI